MSAGRNSPETRAYLLRSFGAEARTRPLLWLGLGLLQFWMVLLYTESKLLPVVALGSGAGLPLHTVPLAVVTAGFALGALLYRRGRLSFAHVRLAVLAGLAAAGALMATVALFGWSGADPLVHATLLAAGSLCVAAPTVWATVAVCALLGRLGGRVAVIHGFMGTLVSTLLICLYHAMEPLGQGVLFVAAPTAATLLLGWAPRGHGAIEAAGHPETSGLRFPTKLALTSLFQGASFGIAYASFPVAQATAEVFATDMAGFVVAAAVLFGTLVLFSIDYNRLIYQVAFVGVGAGYLLLAVAGPSFAAALAVKNAAYAILDVVVISLSAYLVKNRGISAPWIALVTGAALALGQLAGTFVALAAGAHAQQTPAVYAVTAFALVVAALFLAGSNNERTAWGLAKPVDAQEAVSERQQRMEAICERFELTRRERDVFGLLAAGRTKQAIAAKLGISADTAKTHIANIYRKLGVHTQQELISLVEGE